MQVPPFKHCTSVLEQSGNTIGVVVSMKVVEVVSVSNVVEVSGSLVKNVAIEEVEGCVCVTSIVVM